MQAPFKVDLPGDMTYQFQWLTNLTEIRGQLGDQELPESTRKWTKEIAPHTQAVINRGSELGFHIQLGQEIKPNQKGRHASTLEWAKKITSDDIKILAGTRPFSDTVPDPDDGFTFADMRDQQCSIAIQKIIAHRLQKYQKEQPRGYLVREAKKEDVKLLPILQGHVQANQYITKIRHVFARAEMNDDLVLVAAKVGNVDDVSDHEEVLRHAVGRPRPLRPRGRQVAVASTRAARRGARDTAQVGEVSY